MRLCSYTPGHAGGAWKLTLGDGVRGERSLPDGAELWLDANVRTCRRGCNGERAAGAPCQDSPLNKTQPTGVFVLQGDILRCVYLTIIRCCWGGGTGGLVAAHYCLCLSLTLTMMRRSLTTWQPRKHAKGTHRFRARVLWQYRCAGPLLALDAQAALRVDGCPGMRC